MRQARAVARRARVVGRRRDLVLGATLGRARVRLLLLGDGHERPRRVEHRGRARSASLRCMHDVVIRPMREEDVVDADRVCLDVLYTTFAGEEEAVRGGAPARAHPPSARAPIPAAAGWPSTTAASQGVGLALIREGVWGFSLFGVAAGAAGPRRRPRAVRALLGVRRRRRAGISSSARPTRRRWASTRTPGCRSAPAWRRRGSPTSRARPTSTASSTPARRASRWPTPSAASCAAPGHGRDLPVPMAHGARLLVFEDRAFALARGSNLILLGARDEQAAQRDAVGACFVSAPARAPRSTSTSSPPGRTGRCRCAWTRA